MVNLRLKQGINAQISSNSHANDGELHADVFDVCAGDTTDDGGVVSAFKLVRSILNSEFKTAQQMNEHLTGCVRKAPTKFPRTCALLCALEIVAEIASNLLKYIVFAEGDFSKAYGSSSKTISLEYVCAARQYVNNYLLQLPKIDRRPIIYIDKSQVERAFNFYTYVETTTKILFDASLIHQTSQIQLANSLTSHLSRT